MKSMPGRFRVIVVASLVIAHGCGQPAARDGGELALPSPGTVLSPADAILLLQREPGEQLLCVEGIASTGKRLVVSVLSQSQAEHEAGRFYVGVFNEDTGLAGERELTLNRTFFSDPNSAVRAATEMGAAQFMVCPIPASM